MDYNTLKWLGQVAIADGLLSEEEEAVIREYADQAHIECEDYLAELRRLSALVETKAVKVSANLIKGIEFENVAIDLLCAAEGLTVGSRSADNKMGMSQSLDERSLMPDLEVVHRKGRVKVNYWIECKYRSVANNLVIRTAQAERYREVERNTGLPVFVMLGEAGIPTDPYRLYIFPLDEVLNGNVAMVTPAGSYIVKSDSLEPYWCQATPECVKEKLEQLLFE